MSTFLTILYIGALVFWIYWLYRHAKQNPEWFKKESLQKSFHTMGILALLLIGVVWFCIEILR